MIAAAGRRRRFPRTGSPTKPLIEIASTAEEAGAAAELVIYPEGVHVCNNVPFLWRPLAADWLAGKLDA